MLEAKTLRGPDFGVVFARDSSPKDWRSRLEPQKNAGAHPVVEDYGNGSAAFHSPARNRPRDLESPFIAAIMQSCEINALLNCQTFVQLTRTHCNPFILFT